MEDQGASIAREDRPLTPTLRDLLAVAFRHRRLVVISFLGIFLGALLSALVLPKQYEAQMKILVKRERADPLVTAESNAQPRSSLNVTEEELNSEVELLKSRDLLEQVVVACGLQLPKTNSMWASLLSVAEARDIDGAAGKDDRIPRAVRRLEKKLQVEPVKKTNLIEVTYESPDPELAARVLAKLADLYLEKHVAVHRPPGAFEFFRHATEQYREGLSVAETSLAAFTKHGGVVSADLEKESALQKLSEFESTLRQTQAAISETERRIQTLEKQAASTPSRLTTQVRRLDNPQLLQQLKSTLLSLELKRTELLTKFEPSYRLVQEVDSQIAQTRTAITEAENVPLREETTDRDPTYEWLRAELAKARTELAGLHARAAATRQIVGAYRENARELAQKELVQQDLIRAAKAAEENYLLYQRKQEESRITDALDTQRIVNVAIAEAATVPSIPSRPKWLWTVLVGLALAGMVSVGSAFASDYFAPTFRTPDELQGFLRIPVLAAMPKNGR